MSAGRNGRRAPIRLGAAGVVGLGAAVAGFRLITTWLADEQVADTAAHVMAFYVPPVSGGPSVRIVNGSRVPVFDCRVEVSGAEPVLFERLSPFEVAEHPLEIAGAGADQRGASIEFTDVFGHRWVRERGGRPRLARRSGSL